MNANDQPTNVLKAEHQTILRVLRVLERLMTRLETAGSVELESLQKCVEFFRLFADACHHAKEEDLLFPALEARGIPREGGPIGVMLYEHRLARGYTAQMADALSAHEQGQPKAMGQFHRTARQYIDLLTNHIFKEDSVLFRVGDCVLSGDDQACLAEQFKGTNCRTFAGKRREELETIADELESHWPENP